MADWSGIDLGDDLDLNIGYGEAPTVTEPKANTYVLSEKPSEASTTEHVGRDLMSSDKAKRGSLRGEGKRAKVPYRGDESTDKKVSFEFVKKRATKETKTPTEPNSLKLASKKTAIMPTASLSSSLSHVSSSTSTHEHVAPSSTRKDKKLTRPQIDDPNKYHSKPVELSTNALKRPRAELPTSSNVFSSTTFSSLELEPRLVEVLQQPQVEGGLGLLTATNVQSAVIPLLSTRGNMLIRSQTGSGKTLAFLLPMLNDLMQITPRITRTGGTRTLIVCPTRELCHQIEEVLSQLTTKTCCYIVPGSITGGEKKKSEKARLRKGVVVLVSTPGRLLDHLKTTESFTLKELRWVILDEADRLLDMGFEQTILEILSIIRGAKMPGLKEKNMKLSEQGHLMDLNRAWRAQKASKAKIAASDSIAHIMASATLSKTILQLAAPILGCDGFFIVDADRKTVDKFDSPEAMLSSETFTGEIVGGRKGIISFGDDQPEVSKRQRASLAEGESLGQVSSLAQYYMMVTSKWRLAALMSFIKLHNGEKIIVFFSTCDSVDAHTLLFREASWPTSLDEEIPMKDAEAGTKAPTSVVRATLRRQMGKGNDDDTLESIELTSNNMFGDDDFLIYRLHGNVPQKARQAVYKEFSNAKKGVLFCTDVVARGLDFDNVQWIVQYDPPCEITDYLHRAGRTARKGLSGQSVIFLLPSEAAYVQILYSHSLTPEPLSLQTLFADVVQHIPGASKFKNNDEMAAVILQRRLERVALASKHLGAAARQAFRSYVRAYATHSGDSKGVFQVQLLHLGHVAKSFALRESPSGLRNEEDIIAKIANGEFSKRSVSRSTDKQAKREARDEKFKLGNKRKPKDTKRHLSLKEGDDDGSNCTSSASKTDDYDQSLNEKPTIRSKSELQPLRKMGKTKLKASGNFRKSGGGYFRKKLREQQTSEFSS